MERLTERKYGEIVSVKNEEGGISCSSFCNDCSQGTGNCIYVKEMLEKLAEYEDLEEQGKFLKLPYKVGDKVYMICEREVIPFKISSLMICENYIYITVKYSGNDENLKFWEIRISEKDIENRLFFTKEEAENFVITSGKDSEKQ